MEDAARAASAGEPRDGVAVGKHKLSIHGKLGRGTFGSVYKGVLGGYTGNVAVKVLDKPEGDMTEAEAQRLFLKEAQILEKCKHRCAFWLGVGASAREWARRQRERGTHLPLSARGVVSAPHARPARCVRGQKRRLTLD